MGDEKPTLLSRDYLVLCLITLSIVNNMGRLYRVAYLGPPFSVGLGQNNPLH